MYNVVVKQNMNGSAVGTPTVVVVKKQPVAGIEWMSVTQVRQLLNEIRQLKHENKLELSTVLSNQMTVEQFCTIFALGQHKKRFQKKIKC